VNDAPLLYEKSGAIATVTLNRPDVHNAVNIAMRDELWTVLHAITDDPDVRVAVFRGAGDRAFSAGADISEFGTAPSIIEARRARHERDVWGYMLNMGKALIASIHGFAYGAGCELALCCDIRVAADNASFALPEVKLGYIPSAGGTQTLPRAIPPGIARQMILSGEPIDAQRALQVGLVQRVVPGAELARETARIAEKLAALDPAVVAATKEALRVGADLPLEEALRYEARLAAWLRQDRAP
jgi:enoyl-CoA hydratase/carnithine racemase